MKTVYTETSTYNYKKEEQTPYVTFLFHERYSAIKLYTKKLFVEKHLAEELQFAFDEIKMLARLLDYNITWSVDTGHWLKEDLLNTTFMISPESGGPVNLFLTYNYDEKYNVIKQISSSVVDYRKELNHGRTSFVVESNKIGNDFFSPTNSLRELL